MQFVMADVVWIVVVMFGFEVLKRGKVGQHAKGSEKLV